MSWFLGGIGKFSEDFLSNIGNSIPTSLFKSFSGGMFLFAGGLSETCRFNPAGKSQQKYSWLQLGTGITRGRGKRFLSDRDWEQFAESGSFGDLRIDGHYIFIRWNEREINFVTDKTGLRDFYYCVNGKGEIFFSTRIDWLAKFVPAEFIFEEFGSRWTLFNQLSSNSILKNISRVIGGDLLSIDKTTFNISLIKKNSENEEPQENDFREKCRDEINELISFPLPQSDISLSLSGGFDSRLLFSFLLKNKIGGWDAHTFGDHRHPDAVIAERLCQDFNIPHTQISLPCPAPEEFIKEFDEYTAQTVMNNSPLSYLQLRNYKGLDGSVKIIIDGGFGEIWRREFFNRLLFLGSKSILKRDSARILPHLVLFRSDIFSEDIKTKMEAGNKIQLAGLFDELPDPEKIGKENWIDLFASRTRMRNYYSHEQARLDLTAISYMPLAQRSLLKELLSLKLIDRKNGKLFKSILMGNEPALAKYPLVKGNTCQPFGRSTLEARIINRLRNKFGKRTVGDPAVRELFDSIAPYIYDLASSQQVRECGLYDNRKLSTLISNCRKNSETEESVKELCWWLSFELFRDRISRVMVK